MDLFGIILPSEFIYHRPNYFLNSLQEAIYLNSSDVSLTLHNHIMQLWYHPVKLRLKISFAGIPILVQEIANEPSLKKLFYQPNQCIAICENWCIVHVHL